MTRAGPPAVHLIDASYFVFRAYYSVGLEMTDGDGQPVNALYGFGRFLGDLLEEARPEHVAVAFDESLSTSFRNAIYPAYKTNREPAPPDLKRQFGLCRELCRLIGLAEFGSPTHEADDIIGTIAARMRAAGHPSVLVTRDKDLAQLVRDGDHYWDYAGERRFAYDEIEGAVRRAAGADGGLPGADGRCGGQHPGRAGRRPEDRGGAALGVRLARGDLRRDSTASARCRSAARASSP